MKILLLITLCFAIFGEASTRKTEGHIEPVIITSPIPTPTMTLAPTPYRDTPRNGQVVTTQTVTDSHRLGVRPIEINPTLRPCDYYFAQWGRKRAKGTEADPFPVNKRVPMKVGCRIMSEEVNRIVNGIVERGR